MDSFELFKLLLSRQDTEFKAFIKDETREICPSHLNFSSRPKKEKYLQNLWKAQLSVIKIL